MSDAWDQRMAAERRPELIREELKRMPQPPIKLTPLQPREHDEPRPPRAPATRSEHE